MKQAELISKLQSLDYFKYTPKAKLEKVKEIFKNGEFGYDYNRYDEEKILGSDDMRWYGADAENLAELGVSEFIENLYSTLKLIGVPKFEIKNLNEEGPEYTIQLNGKEIVIYSEEEAEDSWTLAPKRVMQIVNEMLEKAGSKERLYGYMGGNELVLAVLTPEIVAFLNNEFYKGLEKCRQVYSVDEIDSLY